MTRKNKAVKPGDLTGCEATITLGTASRAHPAQARVDDDRGGSHFVTVMPERNADRFYRGTRVVLGACRDGVYLAVQKA